MGNSFFSLLKRVPYTLKVLFLSVAFGALLWNLMQYIHNENTRQIWFDNQIKRLNQEAQKGRLNLERFIASFHQGAKLIISQNAFVSYIGDREKSGWPEKRLFHKTFPDWLPGHAIPRNFVQARYVFLMDSNSHIFEVWERVNKPPPDTLLTSAELYRQLSDKQSYMTTVNGTPYLLASYSLTDEIGKTRASIMFATPIDDEFLTLSQGPHAMQHTIALLKGDDPEVIASSRSALIKVGMKRSELDKDHLISGKSFFDYGASDLVIDYDTFLPKSEAEEFINATILSYKRHSFIEAVVLIVSLFILFMSLKWVRGMRSSLDELVSSRDYMDSVINSMSDMLVVISHKGDIISLNASACSILDYKEEDLIGHPFSVICPGESCSNLSDNFIETNVEKNREKMYLKRDGSDISVLLSFSTLKSKNNKVLGIVCVAQDITDRKQKENEIKHNYYVQRVLNSLLSLSLEPVDLKEQLKQSLSLILSVPWLSIESKGSIHIVDDNKRVLKLQANIGFNNVLLSECAEVPFGRCICGRAAESREITFVNEINDLHDITFDGMSPHGHYCIPILSGDTLLGVLNLYVKAGHNRDKPEEDFLSSIANTLAGIIERKQAEERLKETKDALHDQTLALEKANAELKDTTVHLIQSEKLSALGELTAGVAHELNQPLNGIKIISQSILRDIERGEHDESELREDLTDVVDQVNKMAEIIDHMRIFTRRSDEMRMEEVDVNGVLQGPFKLMGQQFKNRNIDIVMNLLPDLTKVYGDAIRLEQVFMNLITNARNAVDENGRDEKRIELHTYNGDGESGGKFIVAEVRDNGTGIPENIRDKIFQPFYTTNEPGKGTGLGLSLSNKIIEEHNGMIEVESEVGAGTVFKVMLPVPD